MPRAATATTSSDPVLGGQRVSWATLCQHALRQPVKSVTHRSIARLWSGYGSVTEVAAVTEDGTRHSLIVKAVDPPPREQGVSHERKLKSYAAEAAFYSHYAARVLASGSAAVIAEPLLVDVSPPTHFLFVLRDLRTRYPEEKHTFDKQEAKAALDWLAAFHALWWEEVPGQDPPVSHHTPFSISAGSTLDPAGPQPPAALWDSGCYWHLATRQQEFDSIPASWAGLRDAASAVDAVLKGQRADGTSSTRHQTLVHGDVKGANLLWDASGRCAAYDFQYVGRGFGVRDVAKLMCAGVDAEVLDEEGAEQELLQHYHTQLLQQLRANGKAEAAQRYSYAAMSATFEIALVDYTRFMAGWGWWGNTAWIKARVRDVLTRLDKVIATAER